MALRKIKFITAMSLVAALIGIGADPKDRPTGATIIGRVVSEPGGEGVSGAVVTLWDGASGKRWTTRTDDTGSYSFRDVEPGDLYKVWIQERPNRETSIWSEDVVVRVNDHAVRAEELFSRLPQSISGTVTDVISGTPVSGAIINFSTADRNRASVITDDEGHYCLFVSPRQVEVLCEGTKEQYYPAAQPETVKVHPNDPHNTVRYGVASALGKIGPAAKSAVPELIRALKQDTGGGVQREAAIALGLIGDLTALPFLREALKSPDREIQKSAAESIKRLEKDL